MTTFQIMILAINIVVSVWGCKDLMKSIKQSPILKAYYDACGTVCKVISWISAIGIGVLTVMAMLGEWGETWKVIGNVVCIIDIVSMVFFIGLYRFFANRPIIC